MTKTQWTRIREGLPEGCPVTSPWGSVQTCEKIGDGILAVSTASHGGIKLDRERNAKIPAIFRAKGGWYEEDCCWAIPIWFLKCEPEKREQALQCLKSWHWKEYEAHFGVIIPPGESFLKDEYLFAMAHVNDWVAISWDKQEYGMIRIITTKGGKRGDGRTHPEERRFWVPLEEYQKRGRYGFVVDETVYKPCVL